MTQATLGNFRFEIGTNASPSVLTNLEEVIDVSELGESLDLLDVTNWDSPAGTKEFIAGLAEGDEFTVECNFIPGAATHQKTIRGAKGSTLPCRLTYLGSSPNMVWTADVVVMKYTLGPSQAQQNRITFTFKISGGLNEA